MQTPKIEKKRTLLSGKYHPTTRVPSIPKVPPHVFGISKEDDLNYIAKESKIPTHVFGVTDDCEHKPIGLDYINNDLDGNIDLYIRERDTAIEEYALRETIKEKLNSISLYATKIDDEVSEELTNDGETWSVYQDVDYIDAQLESIQDTIKELLELI